LEQDVQELFKKVGKVDHIVFTAGDKLAAMPIQEITLENIQRAGQIRFAAPLIVAKIGSQYLEKSSGSSITLTTGSVAERPLPNWSVVAGYASALHGLTRNLAIDLKPIRVNVVSPGGLKTDLVSITRLLHLNPNCEEMRFRLHTFSSKRFLLQDGSSRLLPRHAQIGNN
jgi:NAD(P)-dependent dehydrogenase (short-subunit alcohol dehydrogenase family)